MVSRTPRPHFTPLERTGIHFTEAGWAPGPVWTGGKSRPHRDSIPDHPARSSVAIPTELPGPHCTIKDMRNTQQTLIVLSEERHKLEDRDLHGVKLLLGNLFRWSRIGPLTAFFTHRDRP